MHDEGDTLRFIKTCDQLCLIVAGFLSLKDPRSQLTPSRRERALWNRDRNRNGIVLGSLKCNILESRLLDEVRDWWYIFPEHRANDTRRFQFPVWIFKFYFENRTDKKNEKWKMKSEKNKQPSFLLQLQIIVENLVTNLSHFVQHHNSSHFWIYWHKTKLVYPLHVFPTTSFKPHCKNHLISWRWPWNWSKSVSHIKKPHWNMPPLGPKTHWRRNFSSETVYFHRERKILDVILQVWYRPISATKKKKRLLLLRW